MRQQTASVEIYQSQHGGKPLARYTGQRGIPIYGLGKDRHRDSVRFCVVPVELPRNQQGHRSQIVAFLDAEMGTCTRKARVVTVPMYGRLEISAE